MRFNKQIWQRGFYIVYWASLFEKKKDVLMNLFKKKLCLNFIFKISVFGSKAKLGCILALTNSELKEMVKISVKPQVVVTNNEIKVDWSNPYFVVTNSDFRRA